jgi:hypothetical protein
VAFASIVVMAASYGLITALDAATLDKDGFPMVLAQHEFKAQKGVRTGFWASPLLAGGRIFALDESGVTRIFAADRSFKLLASPAIGEPAFATPAFKGGDIFIRGERHLYCIRRSGG